MKKNIRRAGSLLAGAGILLSGCVTPEQAVVSAREETVMRQNSSDLEEMGYVIETGVYESYDEIANVKGTFSFDQNVLSPTDDVFNMFGTAVTGLCAKPSFVVGDSEPAEYHFINVKGKIRESYSFTLEEIKEREESSIMACSCSTGPAITNARVTGVPIEQLIPLSELEEDVNTITFRGKDGYGLDLPLSYVLEKEAMLVWAVNGTELSSETGGPVQVWMPDTVARYFTRNVSEIELSSQESLPEIEQPEDSMRAKVAIVNRMENTAFIPGTTIAFEGYADDCGKVITAVEFSMDGGKTWTTCDTAGATSERWVYWTFEYTAEKAGTFELQVRACCEDGTVSPLAATVVFTVEETPAL